VNGNRGEVAVHQELVQLHTSLNGANKDYDLVKFQSIQEVNELSVLFVLIQLDVVLLQAMESELSTIVDIDLKRLKMEVSCDLTWEGLSFFSE